MANFANPTVGSNYTDFPGEIRASVNAALQQLSVGTHTNIPTGAIKFDISANRWKKFNGSAFVDLTASYDLNAVVSVNELQLEDNEKIKVGNSQDLQIFFDGTHSKIDHTPATGSLFLGGDGLVLANSGFSQYYLDATENGAVTIRHSGNARLSTNANGVQITNSLGIGGATSNSL